MKKAEQIKNIIEKYGGKTDIFGDEIGIRSQPIGLKTVHLPDKKYFDPIHLIVSQNKVCVSTTASTYTLSQAKAYLERLKLAVKIVTEIESEMK